MRKKLFRAEQPCRKSFRIILKTCVPSAFLRSAHNARRLSLIYYLSYDINFILPRAHTLISLMSCYNEEQGSELSGIRLNRVPPERHRERSLTRLGGEKLRQNMNGTT